MKETRSKKSHDTVPLTVNLLPVYAIQKKSAAQRFLVFAQLQIEMGVERFFNSFLYVLFFVVVIYGFSSNARRKE